MDLNFAHPKWVWVGTAMVLVGLFLVRWARRNNRERALSGAAAEAAVRALKKEGRPAGHRKAANKNTFRNAMSQVFGSVGFILLMAGLLTALFGIVYTGPSPV